MNWAALTKEAFAIYSSIKKLSYYLEDADIVLKSDHLLLKKFLQKNTLNSKVNNWTVEISPYRIKFEYIKGIKNTLADTMSRLIQIDPEAKLQPEQEGYEFGCHAFEDMEPIEYEANVVDSTSSKDPIPLPGEEIKLPARFFCLFLWLCILCCVALGNIVRVYPWIVQALTFYQLKYI